ncbi:hypothetical protein BH09BAC1_BH09BAC1_13760 [soil metagenome]
MNTSALVVMLGSMSVFTFFCGYFFYRVLTTPPKPEPDSYTDNNDQPRG